MANKYVFFATAWSTINGGVNSFNFDLCTAIASVGQSIDVFIEVGSNKELQQAAPSQIRIHELPAKFADFDQRCIEFIASIVEASSKAIWIGHDAISGGAAVFTKNTLGGRAVVFHHMDYSNYYYLKQRDGNQKIQTQKHLLKNADIVFGVGPRLFQNARHLRGSHLETYEILPGVPAESALASRRQFDNRIAICGRLDPSEDKVKNLSAAIKAAQNYLSALESRRGSITLIGMGSSDLGAFGKPGRDCSVAINPVPYIASRDEYFKELMDSDLVLMPSVREGFGLVAWEASCLGIPVLISKSSGIYEFFKARGYESLVAATEITGVIPIDEGAIAVSLQQCLANQTAHKDSAKRLAAELAVNTWKSTAERFISLLEGVVDRAEPPAPVAVVPSAPIREERTRALFLDKDSQTAGFERFEEVLAITARRREQLIEKSKSTDYSRGQRIKFEYWATFSPQPTYFLYIHHSSNLRQTLKRFAKLLTENKIEVPGDLFVLRRDASEPQYVQKALAEEGINSTLHEYTLKEYLWEFGIDAKFKTLLGAEAPLNYIDQAISIKGQNSEQTARELILKKLRGKPECNAHLVLAGGGMGKTWLCRSIASEITSEITYKSLVVLIQAENLRNYVQEVGSAHVQVASVFDLYELHAKSQKTDRIYDRGTFELAVMAGNIVLIIDGLDELATVLQERFDLNRFLGSIVALSSSLSSSHILITTRDSLLVDSDASIEFGIACYELLGFNSSDWTRYARGRFRSHENGTEIASRLNSMLSSYRLKDEGGRVVPFFVDVLCTMLEDESKNNEDTFEYIEGQTPYASNNEIIDHVVHSVFRREIRRQAIDLDAKQLVYLVAELISEQGESFSISAVRHLLDLYYETRAEALLRKISLNPFFQISSNTIRLRYDFLQSYFRSLYLIECLGGKTHTPEALNAYAKSNAAESPEVAYLKKYYEGRFEELENQLQGLVPKLRDYVKSNQEQKRIELGRRAMSGVLKIYLEARGFTGAKMSEKIIELLPGAFGSQSIDGLSIYGEFPPLDFAGKTVFNSKFLDYRNFAKSKLAGAKFISCIFENCASDAILGSSIHLAEFEENCSLGDVAAIVSMARSNHSVEEQAIENECFNFLKGFFKNGASYDPKQSWMNFSSKVRGLRAKSFERLIPEFLIVKTEKATETYYALAPSFTPSARQFIDNNYVDATMKKFIQAVK
jgi:glycosyltransferase involved in cell wall biosynthesis